MKIWALFSIENEYNQPPNNLIKLYNQKPHFNDLKKVFLEMEPFSKFRAEDIGNVLRGNETRIGNADYRLEQIEIEQIEESP